MDLSCFRLDRNPFQRDAELDGVCVPEGHRRLVASLRDELRGATGVIHVHGVRDSGVSLAATLLALSIPRFVTLAVARARPGASPLPRLLELFDTGNPAPYDDGSAHARLAERLDVLAASGVPTAVIVEDAHHLSPDLVGRLARLKTHSFLFHRGAAAGAGVHPRGTRSYVTPRLTREELLAYLVDRVAAAGGEAPETFGPAVLSRIASAAGGLLGRLEALAGECLERASARGEREVTVETVEAVVGDAFSGESLVPLDGPPLPAPADLVPVRPPERPSPDPEVIESWISSGYLGERRRRRGRLAWLGAVTVLSFAVAAALMGLRVWPEGFERREPVHLTVVHPEAEPAELPSSRAPETGAGTVAEPAAPPETGPPEQSEPEPAARPETEIEIEPVPVPGPAPEKVAEAPAGWVVQVGAFRRASRAERMRDRLLQHDDHARIRVTGDGVHAVWSRPMPDLATARALARALQDDGFRTYVRRAADRP